ncbi:hypothetical protein AWZ03_004809 [Drosophila navojoa]|uniref:Uncharacterized protein n=1 Tax=Drosophila navojoa TaxID=7232 RepID=A0A484BIU5_DRONA|nr:hypothetical protein AWZ03_004809 [Drosophila navojoa]
MSDIQMGEQNDELAPNSDLSGLRLETDRDYGLLHSLRPVTPHPGHHEPISLNALRQRLMDAQEESERREDSQIFISKKKTPATNSQRRKGHYSFSETSEAAEAPEQPANCSQPGFTQHLQLYKYIVIDRKYYPLFYTYLPQANIPV